MAVSLRPVKSISWAPAVLTPPWLRQRRGQASEPVLPDTWVPEILGPTNLSTHRGQRDNAARDEHPISMDVASRPSRQVLPVRETGGKYTSSQCLIHGWNQITVHQQLHDVAQSSRSKASCQDVRVFVNGEENDLCLAVLLRKLPGNLDAIHF
jgi:hypothetical protein